MVILKPLWITIADILAYYQIPDGSWPLFILIYPLIYSYIYSYILIYSCIYFLSLKAFKHPRM